MTQDGKLDAAKEKLRKLLALMRQGIGGEAVNAERMMNALMEKYALTLEDFDPDQEEQTARHYFTFTDRWSKELLFHVISKVLNASKFSYFKGRKYLGLECTKTQAVEISLMHEVYFRALKKDLKNFEIAFYHKHNLYPSAPSDTPPKTTLSPEDEMAILKMMRSISPVSYRKALVVAAS